jgi:hypothetical protein
MAQTKYSKGFVKPARRDGFVDRHTYLQTAPSYAKRGKELPHTKLMADAVGAIRSAVKQREALRKHINENLTNQALASQYGVHVRTIEKAISCETHVLIT